VPAAISKSNMIDMSAASLRCPHVEAGAVGVAGFETGSCTSSWLLRKSPGLCDQRWMLIFVTELYLAWFSGISSCRPRSMNWTGGRLHRHAKSNNNSELKAQKQHFARASLNNLVAARSEASNRSTGPSVRSLREVKLQDRLTSETPVQGHNLHTPHFHGTFSVAYFRHTGIVTMEWNMCWLRRRSSGSQILTARNHHGTWQRIWQQSRL